jgi:hypothetical protein
MQAHTPQQNGVSERCNRTIIKHIRSMEAASNCLGFLWTEVINTTNVLVNLSPTRANHGITPDQRYYKQVPRVDHLQIFGSICYIHVPKEKRSKLESKSIKYFFLEYDDKNKVYRLYEPTTRQIHLSRDVVFDKQHISYDLVKPTDLPRENPIFFPNLDDEESIEIHQTPSLPDQTPTLPDQTPTPILESQPLTTDPTLVDLPSQLEYSESRYLEEILLEKDNPIGNSRTTIFSMWNRHNQGCHTRHPEAYGRAHNQGCHTRHLEAYGRAYNQDCYTRRSEVYGRACLPITPGANRAYWTYSLNIL